MRARALGAMAAVLAAACGAPAPPHAARLDAGPSCAELARQYFGVADDRNYCAVDSDCVAHAVECGIGMQADRPGCYIFLNTSSDNTPFATMALVWRQLGCPECMLLCLSPPPLACVGGKCAPACPDAGCP